MSERMDRTPVFTATQRTHILRISMLSLGVLLLAAAPIVGVLPGPGGVVVFAAGLALVLQNSLWAKRRYVDFKRRWPKCGSWADWSLRRASARRRAAQTKVI